jgi:hypothetical protein
MCMDKLELGTTQFIYIRGLTLSNFLKYSKAEVGVIPKNVGNEALDLMYRFFERAK